MKQTIDIPEGYEFDHVAHPILSNGGGVLSVILKKQKQKDFSFYVDAYLADYDGDSSLENNNVRNCIEDEYMQEMRKDLKAGTYKDVPWEIKMGLFKFICDNNGRAWLHQLTQTMSSNMSEMLPIDFLRELN